MTGPVPDAGTDPAGYLLVMVSVLDSEAHKACTMPWEATFYRATAALWAGIADRHVPMDPVHDRWCTWCGIEQEWPCPDLRAAVAAAQAYQDGTAQ